MRKEFIVSVPGTPTNQPTTRPVDTHRPEPQGRCDESPTGLCRCLFQVCSWGICPKPHPQPPTTNTNMTTRTNARTTSGLSHDIPLFHPHRNCILTQSTEGGWCTHEFAHASVAPTMRLLASYTIRICAPKGFSYKASDTAPACTAYAAGDATLKVYLASNSK